VLKYFTVYFAVFAISYLGVRLFRRWSIKRELLDIPNDRSSHNVPTPRGGGIIICLVSVLAFFVYSVISGESYLWAYFAGAFIVSAISLLDDFKTISPLTRILFHALAAWLAVWMFGGFEVLLVPFYGIVLIGAWGSLIAFFWVVWLINAYNFMDGIDGIAATQSITAGIGWSLAAWLLGIENVVFYGGILAFSSFGFLLLNWQPAKIFMGDVGSAFLGYSFAVLPLLAIKGAVAPETDALLPWIGIVLVWFFVFDSVFTLLKRLFRGEIVWQPHREHIYQKLVIAKMSHSKVTCIYGLASAVVVSAVLYSLKFSRNYDWMVFGIVFTETVLLLVFWLMSEKDRKEDNFN
jgi:UDP-N-acetylmuramyl pentapeptide phosphotransferase/UDP-N-acetylglucosamine-1-phosphate transferase